MFRDVIGSLLDTYRSTKLDQLDWITRNRLILKKVLPKLRASHETLKEKPGRLKVAFWSATPWERGGIDHMLATSMLARGHDIHGLYCSGGLESCSMEWAGQSMPDCMKCAERNELLLKNWDLNKHYRPSREFIQGEVFSEIDRLVKSCSSFDELAGLEFIGLKIGELAIKDLPQYYRKLIDASSPEVESCLRRSILGVAQYAHIADNFLNEVQPDRAVVTSGRTVSHTAFYQLCRMRGIPVVTWDESVGGLGAFIFCLNGVAVDYQKEGVWDKIREEPLTQKEEDFVAYYFNQTSRGKFGRHTYYDNPITDREELCSQLGLDPKKKMTVLLSNLTWDTSALDKEIFFDDMIHWLTETIDFFISRPDEQLIVRTHPGEGHLADYARGVESVAGLLKERYPALPKNIILISGKDEYSSHSLCDMASAIVVYTTSLGIEMSVRGREVIGVGRSHYHGRGFTTTVESKEAYFELLTSDVFHQRHRISAEKIRLAKKYAYYFIVRTEAYLDEFNIMDRHQYLIPDAKAFLPGGSKRWDSLCAEIEGLGQFVDCTDYIDPWSGKTTLL